MKLNGNLGNLLILAGVILIIAGLLTKINLGFKLFHLPGDIIIKKENFHFYFSLC